MKTTRSAILIILFFAILIVGYPFLQKILTKEGFEFSCVDGTFKGYHRPLPPPMCFACTPDCFVAIEVFANGQLVCKNAADGELAVTVPCETAELAQAKEILVKYNIESRYGNFSGTQHVQ